jgi:hypothetical protein
MLEHAIANYYLHQAQQLSYKVRLITHRTAYQWLRQPMIDKITRARANAKIDEGIEGLLALAVLIEHGGIYMKNYDALPLKELFWLEDMFETGEKKDNWACHPRLSEIFLTQ